MKGKVPNLCHPFVNCVSQFLDLRREGRRKAALAATLFRP